MACEAKWWRSGTVHNTKTGTIRGRVHAEIEAFSDVTEVCSSHGKSSSSRNHIKLEYEKDMNDVSNALIK